jgi:hypothetical protein
MSPYFGKYGYSRRFHDQFVAAEKEARTAGRGIWAPGAQASGDYDVRRAWWTPAPSSSASSRVEADGKPDWIVIAHWDAMRKLQDRVGKEMVVLGTVGRQPRRTRPRDPVTLTGACSAT